MAQEQKDILKQPAPKEPPWRMSRRIGIHTSTAGGVETAAERAYRLGCSAFQVFSSSPRQWKPYGLAASQCEVMSQLRAKYDLKPLVIHANYLINLAAVNARFYEQSIQAFRGEVERALALCAEYLVVHPGSHRGMTRDEGLARAAAAIQRAAEGLDVKKRGLTVLIENTAGSEFSLGGSFEQVVELARPARSLAHSPIFQVMFAWQNNEGSRTLNLPGVEVGASEAATHVVSKFDLTLSMREKGEAIAGTLEYATSLFDEATVRRMCGYLRTMLAGMAEDEGREIGAIGLLTGEERRQVLEEWNDTGREEAKGTLAELFERQAERTPDGIAIRHGEVRW